MGGPIQEDMKVSSQTSKDISSTFWSAYEQVANEHDEEMLKRYTSDMDALLIASTLFSSVSSAFVVSMESNLGPNPNDMTNEILKVLVNTLHNGTFPDQGSALSVGTGPSRSEIWILTLAYTSLSTSLLAAFGAVMGKQWLGHFQTSHFGTGALQERCLRRQQKLDALETWHFGVVIATLRVFLQLSLVFLGISLSANVWIQQHTVASVILGTTAFGVAFYLFTFVTSLIWPDCPFHTHISTILRFVVLTVQKHPLSRTTLCLRAQDTLYNGRARISRITACIRVYLSRIQSPLRHGVRPLASDTEASGGLEPLEAAESPGVGSDVEAIGDETTLDLSWVMSQDDSIQSRAVLWILGKSTNTEIITVATRMVPEIQWPAENDVTFALSRLETHLYACFDTARQLSTLAQERAVACVKAMYHFYVERNLDTPFFIGDGGDIFALNNHDLYQMHGDQGFRLIACVVDDPGELDFKTLATSDCMWMAHIFTYRLHDTVSSKVVDFVIDFIRFFLSRVSPGRLVADCLLLAGQLMGLRVHRQHLSRLDKSTWIETLRYKVINRLLAVLGEIEDVRHDGGGYSHAARRLLHILLKNCHSSIGHLYEVGDQRMSERCLKLCFRLLEGSVEVGDEDQSNDVAILLHLGINYMPLLDNPTWYWEFMLGPYDWHTPEQFDLLVDYHTYLCDSDITNFKEIYNTFVVLAGLNGSPSTPERQGRYIQTMIKFMAPSKMRRIPHVALHAAFLNRTLVASMGREDEALQGNFSRGLNSAVFGFYPTITSIDENTFSTPFFREPARNLCYLQLFCTLVPESAWRHQLYVAGHFDNCLGIADALSTRRGDSYGAYAVYVTHIIAIVDAAGEENPILNLAIQLYPIWPLVLQAWHFIFGLDFFKSTTEENLKKVSRKGYLEALPSLAAYSRRRRDSRGEPGRLIGLVEQVCEKFDEERQRDQPDVSQLGEDEKTFGHRGIPSLSKEIRRLLEVLLQDPRTWESR